MSPHDCFEPVRQGTVTSETNTNDNAFLVNVIIHFDFFVSESQLLRCTVCKPFKFAIGISGNSHSKKKKKLRGTPLQGFCFLLGGDLFELSL